MKRYIVLECHTDDASIVVGLFSNKRRAKKYAEKKHQEFTSGFSWMEIQECGDDSMRISADKTWYYSYERGTLKWREE